MSNLFDAAEVQYGYPFSTDYFNSTGEGVPVITKLETFLEMILLIILQKLKINIELMLVMF